MFIKYFIKFFNYFKCIYMKLYKLSLNIHIQKYMTYTKFAINRIIEFYIKNASWIFQKFSEHLL